MRCIVIMTACTSKREAARIAEALLEQRLIACANIVSGADSRFWWKGAIDRAGETLLIMKTTRSHFGRVERTVRRLHHYEVPEIIALPIVAGNGEYLRWIEENVTQ